jgi:hypothetical protein
MLRPGWSELAGMELIFLGLVAVDGRLLAPLRRRQGALTPRAR